MVFYFIRIIGFLKFLMYYMDKNDKGYIVKVYLKVMDYF